ncbi:hypothetical protein QL285_087122 [Trifolium repens]|nr:hypothetical protein QL285_087122 [Trifolium repens]
MRPQLSGVVSHVKHGPDYSGHVTLIIPPSYLIVLLKPGYRTYLTTQKTQAKTYIHKQNNSTKKKLNKLGSTLLREVPSRVAIYVAVIFGYQNY